MRAVVADLSVPRYVRTALTRGRAGLLALRDLPAPALPRAPGWVRLRPELSGICGSDVAVAHAKSSPVLSAYYTARHQILGHEIVAVVADTGERVVLDPVLSCVHRGFPLCRSCRDGVPYVCERFDQPGVTGCHSPTQGFDAALGGGWATAWWLTSPSCTRWAPCRRRAPCSPSPPRSRCTPLCAGNAGATVRW